MNLTTTHSEQTKSAIASSRPSAFSVIGLFGVALLMFLPFIGRRDIVTSHEARVYQTARQMAAVGWPWWRNATVDVPRVELKKVNGDVTLSPRFDTFPLAVNPWWVPVLDGRIRLEKPPLPYWCTAVMFRLFGFGEGWARLPCAILGALATLFVFDLSRRLLGNLGGWCAAGVWLSSYFVFDEYRKCMADPYLAFFSLMCVWAWIVASRGGVGVSPTLEQKDVAETPMPRTQWLMIVFYLSLALGALAKGPVILANVAAPIVAFHICYGWKNRPAWWTHLIGLIVFTTIALPWPVYVMRHVPNALDLWRYESVGEFGENIENARPWWFYPPNLLLIALPWTPALLVSPFLIGLRRNRPAWLPIIWYVAIVVFFSFAHMKKNAYLLPMMPAQVLIVAHGCAVVIAGARSRWPLRWMWIQVVGYAAAVFLFVNGYIATSDNARSPKPACAQAEKLMRENGETIMIAGLVPEASVYLPLNIAQDPNADRMLAIMDTRSHDVKAEPQVFQPFVDRRVILAEQVAVNGSLVGRWKLFRLVVAGR